MTVGELREALDKYPADAIFRVGITIPDLYIQTPANASITGDNVHPDKCTEIRFVANVPSRVPPSFQRIERNADANPEGAVQEG